jgi:hypothetical protein
MLYGKIYDACDFPTTLGNGCEAKLEEASSAVGAHNVSRQGG